MTTVLPPHAAALQSANEIRCARAGLRKSVARLSRASGAVRVAELLRDPPRTIATVTILDLLVWVDHVGETFARSMLRHSDVFPIGERKRVRDLSERQRGVLADRLDELADAARSNGMAVR